MTKETRELITDILHKYDWYCSDTFTEGDQCCNFFFNGIIFIIFRQDKDKIEKLIESLARLDDLME